MACHSSIIEMNLRTDHRTFDVVQSGDDYLILREPATFPAGPAILTVEVDGEAFESVTRVAAAKDSIRIYSDVQRPAASLKVAE